MAISKKQKQKNPLIEKGKTPNKVRLASGLNKCNQPLIKSVISPIERELAGLE